MPRPLVPDRRGRILTAAADLILEMGWPHTTVAHIAERAGIGKGAVYREFDDKAAILDAVLGAGMRRMTARVHRQVLNAGDVVDLPLVYRFGVEALLSEPLMRALYLGNDTVLGDHVRGITDARYAMRFSWLAEYIERLQQAGVVADDVPAETITRMLGLFTVGLINAPGVLGGHSAEEFADVVALFADLVGSGLSGSGTVDNAAARRAQLGLLHNLSEQLDRSDKSV